MGLFDKFKHGLEKSSSSLSEGLSNIFSKKKTRQIIFNFIIIPGCAVIVPL